MKQGWEVKKLGELIQKTETIDPTKKPNSEFIYVDVSSVNNQGFFVENTSALIGKDAPSRARKLIRTNDVIFATVRPTLKRIAIIEEELDEQVCSTGYFVLRAKENIHYKLLFYFLLTNDFISKMESLQKGANYPAVTDGEVRNQIIAFPKSQTEQQRIVAILDEAFTAIAKAKANAEQNLKNAKELFESYSQSVFENKGEGWEEKIINEVCELKSGTTISPSLERNKGDVLYTKVGDMNLPDNNIEMNTSSRFVNSNEIKINQIIPEGAIIFPKRGGAIATNKKRKIIKPTIVDLNTMAIIPGKQIDKDYFFHWFQLFDLLSIT
jgi:restriction endonuclease S subunit